MREKYGYPPCSLDEVRRFVGNGARVLMRRALPELMTPEREDALLEEYKAWYMAHNCVRTHPYAGIPALLEELRGAGVTTAVVSNKPHANTVDLAARFFPGLPALRPAGGHPRQACARHGLGGARGAGRAARGRALRRRQRGRRGNGAAQRAGSRGRLVGAFAVGSCCGRRARSTSRTACSSCGNLCAERLTKAGKRAILCFERRKKALKRKRPAAGLREGLSGCEYPG